MIVGDDVRMVSQALVRPTWEDLARQVAWEFGWDWHPAHAAHVLWEFTGFPYFWPDGATPTEWCRRQVREYCRMRLRGVWPCIRCGASAPATRMCWSCELDEAMHRTRVALNP